MNVANRKMNSRKHLRYVHLNVVLPRMINHTTPGLTLAQQGESKESKLTHLMQFG